MAKRKKPTTDGQDAKDRQGAAAVALAVWAAEVLHVADQLKLRTRIVRGVKLTAPRRAALSMLPELDGPLAAKLAGRSNRFTVGEVATLLLASAAELTNAEPAKLAALGLTVVELRERLAEELAGALGTADPAGDKVFQFKITLRDAKPAIWRRIQVPGGTLDSLHDHLQTAMGWTNSHLHQFHIRDDRYGNSQLLGDGWGDDDYEDSTALTLDTLLPKGKRKFRFVYEYDFGDGWEHDIEFEGRFPRVPGEKYPLCLDGQRACPPEDVGGVWGYAEYLEALADPDDEQHDDMLEWNGPFDPDRFDPKQASKAMRKGLPRWRR